MSFLGEYEPNDTIDFKFTTRQFSTGAPFTLAGTPVVSVYKSNNVGQTTVGVTLTVDFDTVTGMNHVRIVTTDAFYTEDQFDVVITAGTVDSVSVVGEVVGHFRIKAAAAGGTDWSTAERNQIRDALGVDGTKTAAAGGQVQTINTNTAGLAGAAMRGTDGASTHTAADVWASATRSLTTAAAITSDGSAINTSSGVVQTVNIVNTTTSNTDMRGTDGAALADKQLGYFQLALRADAGIATDRATELGEINADQGSGAGAYDNTVSPVVNAAQISAPRISDAIAGIGTGTAAPGGSTTSIPTSALDPSPTVSDQFIDRVVTFRSDTATAALRNHTTLIQGVTGTTLTVRTMPAAPAAGDVFTIQ